MRRPAMWLLARRLRDEGFGVRCFPYATLLGQPDAAAARLAEWMRSEAQGRVHLVGHSLGGVTALAMLARERGLVEQAPGSRQRPLPPGRVVCLGSPIAGSQAAAALRARGLGAAVGRSGTLLAKGADLPPDREVGMIAGTRASGLGRWVSRIEGVNDGTVALGETRLQGLADHVLVDASHSGLLLSREAASQCAHFLRCGRFDR